MAILNVENVSKSFGGIQALDDCTFTVRADEVTCVVGPNGAGKTSVFNVITGFIKPDNGTIKFDGQIIDGLSRQSRVHLGIARTFQNLRLFEEMSVLDNVLVCLKGREATNPATAIFRPFYTSAVMKDKRERAMALLEEVGIAHKANDEASMMSYGQKKLLSIARILATDARLLLLDEPTSGLSASALDNMVALIHRLRDLGKTLLVVEHNTRIVQRIADEVLFLHRGTVLAQGRPDEIINNKELGRIYFGEVH
ncbi:MAG: ABC transporter ATP-binding protein [Rhizobiaceae bacterium]|nr:ABC transporter ATP-binding protein [Rhizobiaceae bacterium]